MIKAETALNSLFHQLTDVYAAIGSTAQFSVAAYGSVTYQWQYRAPNGTKWANTSLTGNKTATLSVSATAGRNGYSYRCVLNGTIKTVPHRLVVLDDVSS